MNVDNTESLWPQVSYNIAKRVASGAYHEGMLFPWTCAGASIASNKAPDVRTALFIDAAIAAKARLWNNSDVPAISLRQTSPEVAKEILEV